MRIYEFAQQKNLSSKDIIEKLRQNGFDAKSHMSILDEQALSFVEKTFNSLQKKEEYKNASAVAPVKITPKEEERRVEAVLPHIEPLVLTQMSIGAFAKAIKKSVTEIIITLLKWGIVATRNQVVADSVVKRLADHYEIPTIKSVAKKEVVEKTRKASAEGVLNKRLPVVVVVGHVDHGKTTLLDYVRKTRVALKEKGGITQHLGAYEAVTAHGNIVFLDTPGHEAFGKIRQRGIRVADLVVLVVAVDDGVMPQTVEAIKQAQLMEAPIVVALNKIDKVDSSRIETIKQQLSQHNIIAEDWGGDVICVPISAKFGTGVDQLLEMLVLQSEIMELRAEFDVLANGYILESSIEKGRGPVATVIIQNGVLRVGDYFICGNTVGRVNSIVDSIGRRIKEALPAIPVQVAGFDERPEAGDFFEQVSKAKYLSAKSSGTSGQSLLEKRMMYENGINLVVKADNHSSLEAVVEGIDKLSKRLKKGFNIIRHSIGDVAEGDVECAYNTSSRIICFNVKTESNACDLADRKKISILHYNIIYKLLDDLQAIADELKDIEMVRTKIGEAVVLKVFDIKKIGIIAGSLIRDGRFVRDGFAVIWRGRSKIGEGKISSLQRDKKTVKEIATGFECAFMVNGFTDWLVDDRVECFIDIPKK